ncbi:MAG: hypothetical protein GX050_02605, partial [Firmicutes bacterium]|nr:hypothetical protein [Bacillota bacterium]
MRKKKCLWRRGAVSLMLLLMSAGWLSAGSKAVGGSVLRQPPGVERGSVDQMEVEVGPSVQVFKAGMTTVMSNGLVTVKINARGELSSLDKDRQELIGPGRFYLSYHLNGKFGELNPLACRILQNDGKTAEVVYTGNRGALTFDLHYVLRQGVSGVYCYIVAKNEKAPARLAELRLVMRVAPEIFNYAYTAEREGPLIPPTALQGAPQVQDATYRLADGQIYTKYDWAGYELEDEVHGLCGNNFGVWAISASDEYLNGGPLKQELMVHATDTTPLLLKMFQGAHFGAGELSVPVGWEKLYGPFLIYVNTGPPEVAIADALRQAEAEQSLWPYQWMEHPLYPRQRGTVTGRLKFPDGEPVGKAMVVLAQPGEEIYRQGTDYMFWAPTAADGRFRFEQVRPGNYTLYAYATGGHVTEQFQRDGIAVVGGSTLELGELTWTLPPISCLLWQIGQADRMSAEFKLGNHPRQYGLWEQVPATLEYVIGQSTEAEDWYYAQTKLGSWTIKFHLDQRYKGDALLT